ncbi:hypothetical protein ACFQ88_39345, partial [Paenibacillus sp. NPDC056579]|uniref:hypothetical protein n=1 Tax=Paenibacillus sp. NPDC056579 TaxID=3345871 RepID=UPI0036774C76
IYILKNLKVEWIIKALVLCFMTIKIANLPEKNNISLKQSLVFIITSILLIIAPVSLVAITPKYQEWVSNGVKAYTVTYFSYFGVILLISFIVVALTEIVKNQYIRKMLLFGICLLLVSGSILTDFSNNTIALSQNMSQKKWVLFDKFIKSNDFQSLPEDSYIYSPSLFKQIGIVSNHDEYWNDYVRNKSGKKVNITKSLDSSIMKNKKVYFLKYSQEMKDTNQFLIFSEIKKVDQINKNYILYSDSLTLFTMSKYRKFFVFGSSLKDNNPKELFIDSKLVKQNIVNNFNEFVNKDSSYDDFLTTNIAIKDINLDSVALSYYADIKAEMEELQIDYENDFYHLETNSSSNWRWGGDKGKIVISNNSGTNKKVNISMNISSGFPDDAIIIIKSTSFEDEVIINSNPKWYEKDIEIEGKSSVTVSFNANAVKQIYAPTDPRVLKFRIDNFKVKEL